MPDPSPTLEELASGPAARVRAVPTVAASIRALDDKRRNRLLAIMDKAAKFGAHTLPQEQMKAEGRFSNGRTPPKEIQVFAFKVWQYRVYACDAHLDGKRTFVCTETDEAKKKDKADANKLRQTATKFCQLGL